MAISLDAIYQPLKQFFLQKAGQNGGSQMYFCFPAVPIGFYDSDLLVPTQPGSAPNPAVGIENTSSMVNKTPKLDPNGSTVMFSQLGSISDWYHDELLTPALPGPAADIDAFSQIKNNALLQWENLKRASILVPGNMVQLSVFDPPNWWDQTNAGTWIHQEFDIQGAASVAANPSNDNILRLRMNDQSLQPILASRVSVAGIVAARAVVVQPQPVAAVAARPVMLSHPPILTTRPAFAATMAPVNIASAGPAAQSTALHTQFINQSAAIPFNQRAEVQAAIAQSAPTQPVAVTDVAISFDYCLVSIQRPWISSAFFNNNFWYVPGKLKGFLSINDGQGVPVLPVQFIAVRNLQIKGPWTPADITNLEQSIQFGPFNIEPPVVNGAIGHAGIQIVGWILQGAPAGLLDLPPVGDPGIS